MAEAKRREVSRREECGVQMVEVEIDVRDGADVFLTRYVVPATPSDHRRWIAEIDSGILEEAHAAFLLGVDTRARTRAKAERRRKLSEGKKAARAALGG